MSTEAFIIDTIKNKLLSLFGILFIVVGTIGGILNIILFLQRSLWTLSPCIPFLLATSVSNIITLCSFLVMRTMFGFGITFINNSSIGCKLQFFLFYTSFTLSSWFMVCCCADRFFSSSRNVVWRRLSSMRSTRRQIITIVIVTLLICSQVFYCFEANQINTPGPCFTQNKVCSYIDTTFTFIFQSIGPPVFMLAFGIGTLIHIRSERHIQTVATVSTSRTTHRIGLVRQKRDRAILLMLIIQILLYTICSLPAAALKIYSIIPITIVKTDVRRSAENLLLNMATILILVDKTFSFYIYTLSSSYFRKEFIALIKRCYHRCIREN